MFWQGRINVVQNIWTCSSHRFNGAQLYPFPFPAVDKLTILYLTVCKAFKWAFLKLASLCSAWCLKSSQHICRLRFAPEHGQRAPVPQHWLCLTGVEGRSTGSPWSLIRMKAASPASRHSLDRIPCLTCSSLGTPLIDKFGTVGSIPRELIFALQLLSQWLIVPFGDVVECTIFLKLWVPVCPSTNTRTKGKYLRAF